MKPGRREREAIRRAKWEREQRQRWMEEGFKAARQQAADICRALAERYDDRTSDQRQDGKPPSNLVRSLRNAGNRIRSMSTPHTIVAHLGGDAGEAATLPCDVHLPPATVVKAGCPIATLAQALATPGRPVTFSDQRTGAAVVFSPTQPAEAERDGARA